MLVASPLGGRKTADSSIHFGGWIDHGAGADGFDPKKVGDSIVCNVIVAQLLQLQVEKSYFGGSRKRAEKPRLLCRLTKYIKRRPWYI